MRAKWISFSFLLFAFGCTQRYPAVSSLYKDRMAAREIKREHYEEALTRYYDLLEEDGHRAGTHSNVGVLLNMIQRPEDALKSLQYAEKLAEENGDAPGLFAARYNLGVYFGALKKYQEALDSYQGALEVVPASIETKTNIELLIQEQQKEQQKQNQNQNKDPNQKDQNGSGENKDDKKDDQDKNKDKDKDDKKDQDKDGQDKKDKEKDKEDQKKQGSPKYKPRPFQGEQLSEGDVKKILGELRNQEQKIRANFDKKEKGKARGNEKDW